MSTTQASHEERRKCLRLLEEKSLESRPLTPPCRKVLGEPVSEGLLVLPPEKCRVCSTACNKENLNEQVQYSFNTNQPIEKKPHNIPESINTKDASNGGSHALNGENSCLDNAKNEVPIELMAEFLSCVMKEDYESALSLCNKILSIDPKNKTCLEFQDVIKEKLQQDAESEEDEDDDDDEESGNESSGETDDDDDDDDDDEDDEDDDDDDEDDEDDDDEDDEDDDDEDDEESSDNSSESDTELPVGPINLLMGGLPLRTASRSSQPDDS